MAFDGVVIANIVYDMNRLLTGGRIYKIYQPEADELLLVVKNNKETYRLLISAGASLPLIYFTTKTKANPMTAPNFCMLLRKYISNGRIIEITQPGMERIVEITIEHLNELGDTCRKKHDYRQYQTYFQSGKFCKRSSTRKNLYRPSRKG